MPNPTAPIRVTTLEEIGRPLWSRFSSSLLRKQETEGKPALIRMTPEFHAGLMAEMGLAGLQEIDGVAIKVGPIRYSDDFSFDAAMAEDG
jgi:hypothetical protein